MRFIGSKTNILGFIDRVIHRCAGRVNGKIYADLFAGTVSVAKHFKKHGCKLITNDYLAFSYAFQIAHIKTCKEPRFPGLQAERIFGYTGALNYLNSLSPTEGFFYRNYSLRGSKNKKYTRNYFLEQNAKKIDSIVQKIGHWCDSDRISTDENLVLRTSLLNAITKVSNTSGTYGAFLKIDDNRKFLPLRLEPVNFTPSKHIHKCFNEDIFNLIKKVSGDILYLDPPYNQRQYPPYYHILETATLDDNPAIYGKTGRRPYEDKLSPLCIKTKAKEALDTIFKEAQFKHIFLSYNTEGLLPESDLSLLMSKYGKTKIFRHSYRRYKSNCNGANRNGLEEIIFYVRK